MIDADGTSLQSLIKSNDDKNENGQRHRPDYVEETSDDDGESRHHFMTDWQAFLHLLKSAIGPGCLSLPWAFSNMGIALGSISVIVICLLTAHNSLCVMKIKQKHIDRRGVTYSDIGEIAYGKTFRSFVTMAVCTQQLAICTVYFDFFAENISAVIKESSGEDIDKRFIMLMVFPLVICLILLPTMRALVFVMQLATFLMIVSYTLIFIIVACNWDDRPTDSITTNWDKFPQSLCAVMYSFEAINLILPVENEMKTPSHFNKIFKIKMLSVYCVFNSFAVVCVLAFGDVDEGSVTAHLMENSDNYDCVTFIYIVNIIISISVLLTYPIQIFPCYSLISQMKPCSRQVDTLENENDPDHVMSDDHGVEPNTNHVDQSETSQLEYTLMLDQSQSTLAEAHYMKDSIKKRVILVIITLLVALAIPNVDQLISLAGALAGSSSALIIPPLLTLRYIPENDSMRRLKEAKCYVLFLVGVTLAMVGTIASIADIFNSYLD